MLTNFNKNKMFLKKIFVRDKSIHDFRTITIRIKYKNSSYLEHLKPIIVALKLFGVMPLTENEDGKNNNIFY